jgi:N-acyl-L-homoserine lactone synthetase
METGQNDFYFKVAESSYELQSCYRLRHKVYCEEKKWLRAADYPDGMEYDIYDEKAVQVIAMDKDFNAVGTMRIIRESDFDSLPYENHPSLRGRKLQYENLVELSRFVIRTDRNGLSLAKGLLRAVYQTSINMGVGNWINVCEPSLVRLLAKFKYYFKPLAPPSLYYGGFTQPVILGVKETQHIWRTSDKEAWDYYHQQNAMLTSFGEVV